MKALSNCLRLLAIAVAIVTFGSCSDENDYYWSPLIGDWVLVADEYGPVDTDQNIFSFYSDGSGQYVDYDNWGQSYTYDIYWDTDGTALYISFADGQDWNCIAPYVDALGGGVAINGV
ncbi:MAG: hypothetical protein K2L66_00355, partial [Paramuribaculum sp.]|nr:hypothetical protein [Paramuribaculum sp.]